MVFAGNQASGKVDLSVITADGKTVIKKEGATVSDNNIRLGVGSLANGVYLIEVVTSNGDRLMEKFVKE